MRSVIAGSIAGEARSRPATAVFRRAGSFETSPSSHAVSSRAATSGEAAWGAAADVVVAEDAGGASARASRGARSDSAIDAIDAIVTRLLGDSKIRVITRETTPAHVDRVDAGG